MSKDTQQNTLRLVEAATEAMTDGMVERLSITGANALEVVDRLNDDDTKDAVMNIIDRVTELQRSGALNTLFDLVILLHGVRSALTDSMVERLVMWAEHMVTNVANEDVANLAGHVVGAIQDAAQHTEDEHVNGGMFATLSMLSKPETQKSLNFLLGVAANIQQCATKKSK
ncbi:MAG: hypothetical protein OEW37_05280 [Rhodospirillaceae bacterium]|nr:hypothetical protein [Rhodospirillaceae bacterium]